MFGLGDWEPKNGTEGAGGETWGTEKWPRCGGTALSKGRGHLPLKWGARAEIRERRPHRGFRAEVNRQGRGQTMGVWLTNRGVPPPLRA